MVSMDKTRQLLDKTRSSCAAMREDMTYTSDKKGIAPILDPLKETPSFFEGAYVADKVIGKSAAILLVKAKIRELYAVVISDYAAELLERHQIPFSYGTRVPFISNRTGTGMCAMEQSVLGTDDIEAGYEILDRKLQAMRAAQDQGITSV